MIWCSLGAGGFYEYRFHHSTPPTCLITEQKKNLTTSGLLWKDRLREPLQIKAYPTSQDFKHSFPKQPLSIQCRYNACWVQGELKERGLQPAERGGGGEVDVEWKTNKVYSIYHRAQQQEGEEEEADSITGEVNHEPTRNGNVAITLVASLKACSAQKDLQRGSELHADIVRSGLLDKNVFIGSTLVSMYAKCGALLKAQEVFDELSLRNTISWTALIAGYAQHGHGEEALKCYEKMLLDGFSPNAVTFVCALKACNSVGNLETGGKIHAHIENDPLLRNNIVVVNALVGMYAKCGALVKARELFEALRVRDVVSWTTLVSGFTQHGHDEEALSFFERMQLEGYAPDAFTLVCVLDACGSIGAAGKCQFVHTQIVKGGLLEKDIIVANALVNAYANCGVLAKAQEVFDELLVRDIVTWNSLIAGYARQERGKEALSCFEEMQLAGFCPDAITYAGSLKACGTIRVVDKGHDIHAHIVKAGLLERELFVGTSLVDMYAKCGSLAKAQRVFDELPVRDIVSWTSLITGYAQHEYGEEALLCFGRMQLEGISPDAVTFARIAQACGSLGAAYKGLYVHAELVRLGLLEQNMVVSPGLIDMYASCGMLREAQDVFDKVPVRNVVSWSALMVGYAQLGKDESVFNLFDKMIGEGTQPDLVTFTVVLNTCSHRGLFNKGQVYFEIISKDYDIMPSLEHHTCMVDLFGRAGHFEMAAAMIEKMPFLANLTLWHTLLGAFGNFGNSKLGRWAYEHAAYLNEKDAAAYVGMSNMYASAGR